jgi:hypothetical protein
VSDVKILAFDIETAPMITYNFGLWNQNIGINQIVSPSRIICFAARWIDQPKRSIQFYSEHHHGHEAMTEAAWELIDEADALLGWNSKKFDEQWFNTEFLLYDLGPPSPVFSIDLMAEAKRKFRFESNKLDWVSKRLELGRKMSHAGMQLWIDCMAGDDKAWTRMQAYNEQDVHLLVDGYNRMLPWIKLPNQNLYRVIGGCPTPACTGTPQKRGTRSTQAGTYQRYHCPVCRSWSTSGVSIERADLRREA